MSLDKEDIKWEKKKRRTPIITSMEKVIPADTETADGKEAKRS